VTLVFTEGIELEDPAGLLRGTGTRMRHVRVTRPSDIARPELRSLLRLARALAAGTERPGRGRRDVVTRVKPRAPTAERVRGRPQAPGESQ
jgi:hypothetical protein